MVFLTRFALEEAESRTLRLASRTWCRPPETWCRRVEVVPDWRFTTGLSTVVSILGVILAGLGTNNPAVTRPQESGMYITVLLNGPITNPRRVPLGKFVVVVEKVKRGRSHRVV